MAVSRAELKAIVTLNAKAFTATMRRIQRQSRMWGNRMTQAGRIAARATAVAAAGATAAAYAVYRLTKQTADAGDAFDKMSLRTGISAQVLSEYAHVARITGASQEDIAKGLKILAKTVSYAKDGLKTYTREFDKLGITMADLDGKTPQAAFEMVLGALDKMPDAMQKAATAQVLFGRAGTQLLPLAKLGAEGIKKLRDEANELGITFSDEAAKKAAEFNDSLTRLKGAMEGVRNKLVIAFIKQFSGSIETLVKKIVRMRKEGTFTMWAAAAANSINDVARWFRTGFSTIVEYAKYGWLTIKREAEVLWDALVIGLDAAATGMVIAFNNVVARAKIAWTNLKAAGEIAFNLLAGVAKLAFLGMQATVITIFAAVASKIQRDVNIIIAAINAISGRKIAPIDLRTEDAVEALKGVKKEMGDTVDSMKIDGDAWKPLDDAAKKVKEIEEAQRQANEITMTGLSDEARERQKRFKENIDALRGGTDLEETQRKIAEKTLEINKQHDKIGRSITKWQRRALQAEMDRGKAAGKVTAEMQEQGKLLQPLKGVFGGIAGQLVKRRRIRTLPAQRKRNADAKKLAEQQLAVQKQIAENTGRQPVAQEW